MNVGFVPTSYIPDYFAYAMYLVSQIVAIALDKLEK